MRVFQIDGDNRARLTGEAARETSATLVRGLRRGGRGRKNKVKVIFNPLRYNKSQFEQRRLETLDYVRADAAPRTYGQCRERGLGTKVACPFVACKYHLMFDDTAFDSLRANFPRVVEAIEDPMVPVATMKATCQLAIADERPRKLEEIARHMNVTTEHVRQMLLGALAKILARLTEANVEEVKYLLAITRKNGSGGRPGPDFEANAQEASERLRRLIERARRTLSAAEREALNDLPALFEAIHTERDARHMRAVERGGLRAPSVVRCVPQKRPAETMPRTARAALPDALNPMRLRAYTGKGE